MRKSVVLVAFVFLLSISFANATICDPEITLLNQDPYPAEPGNYVNIVFQMSEIDNPECGQIFFEIIEEFPFSLKEQQNQKTIQGNTYLTNFGSSWLIPYKIAIDENALDGPTKIKVRYSYLGSSSNMVQDFNIEIEDYRSDFEIYVKDYSYTTHELTLEILNIKDDDVEALTIEIPKQENIQVKGSNRIVVGDLDSNEYTTADFEATPQNGDIKVNIIYTDLVGVRRSLEKIVNFDSSFFSERKTDQKGAPTGYIILILIILIAAIWIFLKKQKKKKERARRNRGMAKL